MTDQDRDELVAILKEALADCMVNHDHNQKAYVDTLVSSHPFAEVVTEGVHQLLHDTQGRCDIPQDDMVTIKISDVICHTMSAISIGIDVGQTMVKLGAKFPRPPVN